MAVRDNAMVNINTDEEIKKVLDLLGQSGDSGDATLFGKIDAVNKTVGTLQISNQTILAGAMSEGTKESPLVITGKGYLYISQTERNSSGSGYYTKISVDDKDLYEKENTTAGVFGGWAIPFFKNVSLCGKPESGYSNGLSYVILLQK